jgi:TIR domain
LAVPKRVFISYRREDSADAAGRVYDRLSDWLSESNVFFDVSTIRGGEDFEKKIAFEIGRSDAALIFIGNKWLEPAHPTGKVRIWQADDHVRAEVRAALARAITVLPVLVAGARMPDPNQLPEDIRAITTKNALPLRHESFDDDTENIVRALGGGSARRRTWKDKGTLWSKVAYSVGGAIAASVIVVIGALVHFWVFARPLAASIGGPMMLLLLITGLIFGAWLGLSYETRRRRAR